jgi:hypothetical protein
MSLTRTDYLLKPTVVTGLSSVHRRFPHVLEWADLTSNDPPTPAVQNIRLS